MYLFSQIERKQDSASGPRLSSCLITVTEVTKHHPKIGFSSFSEIELQLKMWLSQTGYTLLWLDVVCDVALASEGEAIALSAR